MRILATLFALTLSLPAYSHEFWIEPLEYQISPDTMIQGELVNGQEFEGSYLAYLPQRFGRFTMHLGDEWRHVENRLGARPALDNMPLDEGLHAIAYQSNLSTIEYTEWAKFLRFAEHKDFGDIEAWHDGRGLPREGFTEGYWRFAKSLIGVGHGQGDDIRTGLPIEFVALDNPYTADVSDGLRVQLFFEYDPRTDVQVELFEKAPDGSVNITLHRTDENGIVVLPVQGGHSYLVDSVLLREAEPRIEEASGAVWETLWASLTFAVPE